MKKSNRNFINSFKISTTYILILNFLFSILFYIKGVLPLLIFSILSVFLFTYFILIYINKNIVLATIFTFLQSSLQTLFYVYFIGWGNGFYIYPLCLIPIIYYVCINILKKDKYGHILVILTFFIYQLTKIFSENRIAMYEEIFIPINELLYKFNTFNGSCIYAFLMYAFLSDLKVMQEDLETKNKALEYMANIDLLTGISNRRCMNCKISKQIEEFSKDNKAFSIAICDIDDFKTVNDTYGHDCGDIVLKSISEILIRESNINNIDISRWGGEEFLILIRGNINNAKEICQTILDKIRDNNIKYNSYNIKVTMTIGIAEFNSQNNNIDKVLKKADINLYQGKKSNKNCIIY